MLKRLRSLGLIVLCLLGLMGLQSFTPVSAAQEGGAPTQVPPGLQVEAERFQAVLECLPRQLGIEQSDPGSRIARAFGEWGKDQFERTFNMKADPQLTSAEREFESCLEDKGITPMRKLQQTAYR